MPLWVGLNSRHTACLSVQSRTPCVEPCGLWSIPPCKQPPAACAPRTRPCLPTHSPFPLACPPHALHPTLPLSHAHAHAHTPTHPYTRTHTHTRPSPHAPPTPHPTLRMMHVENTQHCGRRAACGPCARRGDPGGRRAGGLARQDQRRQPRQAQLHHRLQQRQHPGLAAARARLVHPRPAVVRNAGGLPAACCCLRLGWGVREGRQ